MDYGVMEIIMEYVYDSNYATTYHVIQTVVKAVEKFLSQDVISGTQQLQAVMYRTAKKPKKGKMF